MKSKARKQHCSLLERMQQAMSATQKATAFWGILLSINEIKSIFYLF
jgi:hypothetical protein